MVATRLSGIAATAFVGLATNGFLALVFELTSRGWSGLPGVAVYGFAAAFGLEFLGAAWTERFGSHAPGRVGG